MLCQLVVKCNHRLYVYLSIRQARYDFARFLHSGSFIPLLFFIQLR
jgi:hypothetical protein